MHHRKVLALFLLALFFGFPAQADPSPLGQVQITEGMTRADLGPRQQSARRHCEVQRWRCDVGSHLQPRLTRSPSREGGKEREFTAP